MVIKLSYDLDEHTPMYGGKQGFLRENKSSIDNGDSANTQQWSFPNHLGTHVDFPVHFHQQGTTSDQFPPDYWVIDGKHIHVIEVNIPPNETLISTKHLPSTSLPPDCKLLLIKTGYGTYRTKETYWTHNPGINVDVAEWMIATFPHLRFIGLDSISISSWQHRDVGRKVHKILLNPKKPVLPIEDMDLSKISQHSVFQRIYIAPLLVRNADGAPCTILAEESEL